TDRAALTRPGAAEHARRAASLPTTVPYGRRAARRHLSRARESAVQCSVAAHPQTAPVTAINLLTAATWSYGLSGVLFLAFALRMALGWHGGVRAALLFSAIIASALWAASEVALATWPSAASTIAAHGFDTLR